MKWEAAYDHERIRLKAASPFRFYLGEKLITPFYEFYKTAINDKVIGNT